MAFDCQEIKRLLTHLLTCLLTYFQLPVYHLNLSRNNLIVCRPISLINL